MPILQSVLAESRPGEREKLKAAEYERAAILGLTTRGIYRFDVQSVNDLGLGAVEVYFRAWRNRQPVGFGEDGSVEIERYIAVNPPLMVRDPLGSYVIGRIDRDTGLKIGERRYREDPAEALFQQLEGVVDRYGKGSANIELGKIGRTTLSFRPGAGSGNAPTDGILYNESAGGTDWATIHDAAASSNLFQTALADSSQLRASAAPATTWRNISRSFFQFNTGPTINGGTVTAASLILRGTGTAVHNSFSASMSVVSFTPGNMDSIAVGDYSAFGTTVYATKTIASWDATDGNTNTWTLSDLTGISTSGMTQLGLRESNDIADTEPGITGGERSRIEFSMADDGGAGTTDDPELSVTWTPLLPPAQIVARGALGGIQIDGGMIR